MEKQERRTEDESTLELDRMEFLAQIGTGNFSSVYKAVWRGDEVAVKIDRLATEHHWQYVLSEIRIHNALKNPFIVDLKYWFKKDEKAYLITELCRQNIGNIVETVTLSHSQAWRLSVQLITGLEYVHGKTIIHRDLNPANCLLDFKGNLQICDFGHAVIANSEGQYPPRPDSSFWVQGAPEIMNDNKKYSFKSDIYDMGATIYYIFMKEQHGSNKTGEVSEDERKFTLSRIERIPYASLIFKMMEYTASARPTCTEILTHDPILYDAADSTKETISQDNPNCPGYDDPSTYDETHKDKKVKLTMPESLKITKTCEDSSTFRFEAGLPTPFMVNDVVKVNFGFFRNEVGSIKGFDTNGWIKLIFNDVSDNGRLRTLPPSVLSKI